MLIQKANFLKKILALSFILAVLFVFPYAVTVAGNDNISGQKFGPSITIEKSFSFDGGTTWLSTNEYTSPFIAKGTPVEFRFVIKNSGSVSLTALNLIDDVFIPGGLSLPDTLLPGDSYTHLLSDITAVTGQHRNIATVTAVYSVYQKVTANSAAYYYGYNPQPGPAISIKKSVSVDGGSTWEDADAPPGPNVTPGSAVRFKFVITNSGSIPLTGLSLIDDVFIPGGLSLPGTLLPGNSYTHLLSDITAVTGQHRNKATVSAVSAVYSVYQPDKFRASDLAHYYGDTPQFLPRPALVVKKYVSVDNGTTWLDAETPTTGPTVTVGSTIKFKFVITNSGNVALSNIKLNDSVYSLGGIALPASLSPGTSFEHILTAVASSGEHINKATATGKFGHQLLSDTDLAHYLGIVPSAPAIAMKKYISTDGGKSWTHTPNPTGLEIDVGKEIQFKFLIRNTGDETLKILTLTDSVYDLKQVGLPTSLAPGSAFEYVLKGITASSGQHSNKATVSAVSAVYSVYPPDIFSDSDMAHYYGITPVTPSPPSPPDKETPPTEGYLPFGVLTAALALLLGLVLLVKNKQLGLLTRKGKL